MKMQLYGIVKINFVIEIFKMKNKEIIYSLNVEDIQTVAEQELERELSKNEIKQIIEAIAERINWYDAIADAINEKIKSKVEL